MKLSQKTRDILNKVKDQLWIKNIMSSPKIDKVIVAIWIWSLATRKGIKDFSEIERNLQKITWQKPYMILSKRSISNFKLRDWMPSMLKVTLRGQKAYDFIDKVSKIVLPRIRDFNGLNVKSFDNQGDYSLWLKSYWIFPELKPDDITMDIGLQISIVMTSNEKEKNKVLLENLGFVFK